MIDWKDYKPEMGDYAHVVLGHPPPAPGMIRCYEDHTGRNYRDVSEEDEKKKIEWLETSNDPEAVLFRILREEIQKEVVKEIAEKLKHG